MVSAIRAWVAMMVTWILSSRTGCVQVGEGLTESAK
jgi:hypothetical protein